MRSVTIRILRDDVHRATRGARRPALSERGGRAARHPAVVSKPQRPAPDARVIAWLDAQALDTL